METTVLGVASFVVGLVQIGRALHKERHQTLFKQFMSCLNDAWEDTAKQQNWQNKTVPKCFSLSEQDKNLWSQENLQSIQDALNQLDENDNTLFNRNCIEHLCNDQKYQGLWKYVLLMGFLSFSKKPNTLPVRPSYILTPNVCRWKSNPIHGRDDFIDEVYQKLQNDKDGKCHMCLTGMGGSGKTEILHKVFEYFADNPKKHNFEHIALLSYKGSMDDSLTQINCPSDRTVEAVWTYMRMLCEKASVLFLIDDIRWQDGKEQIYDIDESFSKLFTLNATVLFASRALENRLKDNFTSIKLLPLLPVEECKKIFKDERYKNKNYNLTETDETTLSSIIKNQTGYNPLIVKNLGAMAQNRACSIAKLAELLEKENFDIRKEYGNDRTLQEEINKRYSLESINDVKIRCLLEAFALFPNIPLERKKCIQWLHEDANMTEDDCSLALNKLANLTWLMLYESEWEGPESVFYSMHQLVQTAIITQTNIEAKNHQKLIEQLKNDISLNSEDTFEKAKPYILYAEFLSQYFVNKLKNSTEKFTKNYIGISGLINWVGRYYSDMAIYPKSLKWYENALAIYQKTPKTIIAKILRTDRLFIAVVYGNISQVYICKGQYEEAWELCNKALAIIKRALIKGDLLGRVYNNMALIHFRQGRYVEALEWHNKALAIDEKVSGKNHPDTATSYSNIGLVYFNQGKYAEALTLFNKALTITERAIGKEHPLTAIVYNNIATVYSSQGKYVEASEWHTKALTVQEKVLGKEHPDIAYAYGNIATVYASKGDHVKALELYEKALVIAEKVLGKEHPLTAMVYNNIATVYSSQGKYVEASELHTKALTVQEKVLDQEHPDIATTYNNIALVYFNQEKYIEALKWYEKALTIAEKALGKNHPTTATIYNSIASVYDRQGKYVEALEWNNKALTIRELALGVNHPDIAYSYTTLAGVCRSQGDYVKALELYGKALVIMEKVLDKEHPDIATIYNNIAGLYRRQMKYEDALTWNRKALTIHESVLGKEHPSTINTCGTFSDIYYEQGEYSISLEYEEKILNAKLTLFGKNSIAVARSFNNIGVTYRKLKNYDQSLYNHFEALKICVNLFGENGEDTCASYKRIADTYKDSGDSNQAITYYLKATNNSVNVKEAYLSISELYEQTGECEKAQEYKQKAESSGI